MEREALRNRLAVLDKAWMELAQSRELQSLLERVNPPPVAPGQETSGE